MTTKETKVEEVKEAKPKKKAALGWHFPSLKQTVEADSLDEAVKLVSKKTK